MLNIFLNVYLSNVGFPYVDKLTLSHPMKPAKKSAHKNVDGDSLSRKRFYSPGFSSVLCFSAPASEICDGISIRSKIGTSNCHICLSRPSMERFFLKQIYLSELISRNDGEFRFLGQQRIAFANVSEVLIFLSYLIEAPDPISRRPGKIWEMHEERSLYLNY